MTDRMPACYVDSNVLIYLIEGDEPTKAAIRELLETFHFRSQNLVTSEITIGECLIGAAPAALNAYHAIFAAGSLVTLAPVKRATVEQAVSLGALNGLKLIDAIHLATAIETGCETFVTNDRRIRAIPDLTILRPLAP